MICNPAYIVKDNSGNVGTSVPVIQGETKLLTVYLFNEDGSPMVLGGTITEIIVKVFSQINQASIQKKLSLSTVTAALISGTQEDGLIGFQFGLSGADTTSMAANNSGLPMTAVFTDSTGIVTELDFASVFNVSAPLITT